MLSLKIVAVVINLTDQLSSILIAIDNPKIIRTCLSARGKILRKYN